MMAQNCDKCFLDSNASFNSNLNINYESVPMNGLPCIRIEWGRRVRSSSSWVPLGMQRHSQNTTATTTRMKWKGGLCQDAAQKADKPNDNEGQPQHNLLLSHFKSCLNIAPLHVPSLSICVSGQLRVTQILSTLLRPQTELSIHGNRRICSQGHFVSRKSVPGHNCCSIMEIMVSKKAWPGAAFQNLQAELLWFHL